MKKLLILIALFMIVACKEEKPVIKHKCVEYAWGLKPFCENPSRLSSDPDTRAIQLRICADPEKRKLKKCVRMERI